MISLYVLIAQIMIFLCFMFCIPYVHIENVFRQHLVKTKNEQKTNSYVTKQYAEQNKTSIHLIWFYMTVKY